MYLRSIVLQLKVFQFWPILFQLSGSYRRGNSLKFYFTVVLIFINCLWFMVEVPVCSPIDLVLCIKKLYHWKSTKIDTIIWYTCLIRSYGIHAKFVLTFLINYKCPHTSREREEFCKTPEIGQCFTSVFFCNTLYVNNISKSLSIR